MINISKITLITLENVQKRTSMYVAKADFDSVSNFFVGYFVALQDITGIPYNHDISIWINRKKRTSLCWEAYIFHVLAKGDASKAYSLIFSELKAFFEDIISSESI